MTAAVIPTLVLMTIEALWRYLTYVRSNPVSGPLEFAFGHETALLVGLLVVLSSAWVVWGPNRQQRLIALSLSVLAFVVLLTMRRRAGLMGAETGLLCIGLFLLLKEWRRFLLIAPVVVILSAAYLGVFWNNPNSMGEPARVLRTVFDPGQTNDRDRASDDYRRAEMLNVWWAIHTNPIEGAGFGTPYAKPMPMWDLSSFWPFWDYIPHNTILWLWLKGGIFALLSFWCVVGFALQRSAAAFRLTDDPVITGCRGERLRLHRDVRHVFLCRLGSYERAVDRPSRHWPWPREPLPPPRRVRERFSALTENRSKAMRISVVMCTRGRAEMIGRAVGSVLDNDHDSFEMFVVDQSDDDFTRLALAEYMHDERFHYLHLDRIGLSHAYNVGIQAAAAELIAFTDDDCVAPRRLAEHDRSHVFARTLRSNWCTARPWQRPICRSRQASYLRCQSNAKKCLVRRTDFASTAWAPTLPCGAH